MNHTIDINDYETDQEKIDKLHNQALELAMKVQQFKRLYYYNLKTDKY